MYLRALVTEDRAPRHYSQIGKLSNGVNNALGNVVAPVVWDGSQDFGSGFYYACSLLTRSLCKRDEPELAETIAGRTSGLTSFLSLAIFQSWVNGRS